MEMCDWGGDSTSVSMIFSSDASQLKIMETEVKSLPQSHIYITAKNHRNRGNISSPITHLHHS
jgi:hypothetical protein